MKEGRLVSTNTLALHLILAQNVLLETCVHVPRLHDVDLVSGHRAVKLVCTTGNKGRHQHVGDALLQESG